MTEPTAVCVREGASPRTSDELALVFLSDVEGLGITLPEDVRQVIDACEADLDLNGNGRAQWLTDEDLSESLTWAIEITEDLPAFYTHYFVEWEDGYVIYDHTGCSPDDMDAWNGARP